MLTSVLRDEWDFDGFNTSDWGGVHSIVAVVAGTDLEEPSGRYFGAPLQKAVTNGTISRAVLNTMVERILYQMFRFHLFTHPPSGSFTAVVTTQAHRAVSTRVAEAGTVLLKNDSHLLPLRKSEHIAVIGPAASAQVTIGGDGSAHVVPSSMISPLAGIEAVTGLSHVGYTQGLPTDEQLTPVPVEDLSKPASPIRFDTSYSGTLTPPETGNYIFGIVNNCHRYTIASLAINGRMLIYDLATPPVKTYSAAVHLKKGHAYVLTLRGPDPMMGQSTKELKKLLQKASPKRLKTLMEWMKCGAADKLVWATPSTVQTYIQKAVRAAKSAKVAVVVVGDDTESEGVDRFDMRLPSAQNALVSAVAKANPHTVVVIQAGAPIAMPWLDKVPAILDTWYPGQTNGKALAKVLFGRVDPSGHLPVTFPRRLADVPTASPQRFPGVSGKVYYSEGLLVGYRWYDAKHIRPMFPFGFGLSYTHFRYSDLELSQYYVNGVTPIRVSARVTNVGKVAGTDVAQLYLGMPLSTGEPPRKLVAFHRITLAPGQSSVVHFIITPRDEWWWGMRGWTETMGHYSVYVGDSSALRNLPLIARYEMKESIGDRQVTVSAPKIFRPGSRAVVSVSLSAGGNETLHNVKLNLKAPAGWQVIRLGHAKGSKVAPGQVVTERFSVTAPSDVVSQYVVLYGTADLLQGACTGGGLSADESNVSRENHHPSNWISGHKRRPNWAASCGVSRHSGETVLLGS